MRGSFDTIARWTGDCHLAVIIALMLTGQWSRAQSQEQRRFDTVIVCAPTLMSAALPWIEYRSKQGHQIAVLSGSDSIDDTRATIRQLAKHGLKHVVLFGDAPNHVGDGAAAPVYREEANLIRRWGAGDDFAADNWFADVDDDGIPELSVGRICADSASELSGIVAKTLAYEQVRDLGLWRRRVNFVAGVGGFGALTDSILEMSAKKLITDGIPAGFRTTMTQASWRSPYSPDPRLFRSETIERMNEGCFAWVYLGHGLADSLDHYRYPGGGLPIFTTQDVRKVSSRVGSPIAVFLSCYAGDFTADEDCLAEELLAAPGGPVAVVAGSSITMPYAMTVMGNAMLEELFAQKRKTIGEVLLHAKRTLAQDPAASGGGGMIDKLAKIMSPNPDELGAERLEHVKLFNLLGDPLLRIRHPKVVKLEVSEYGTSGESIEITGQSEINGPCLIELVCRRDRTTIKPKRRSKFEPSDQALSAMQVSYAQANNTTWASLAGMIENGTLAIQLPVPSGAMGPSHVRIFVEGEQDFAMGSADIYLRPLAVSDEGPAVVTSSLESD